MADELMKCNKKECKKCFANVNGECTAILHNCDTPHGFCKFYQDKTMYLRKIENIADKKVIPLDDYIKQADLQQIVDNCKE